MPFDELSVVSERIKADFQLTPEQRKAVKEDRMDEILELLILSYLYGNEAANDMLYRTEIETRMQSETETVRIVPIDTDSMNGSVYRDIAGENWEQRVSDYYDSEDGTADDVIRVLDTDSHRIYNDAIEDVGERSSGRIYKTWETMLDDRVRDTHEWLQSVRVPLNERFYTFDGDSARYPGDFTLPQNNINCRCRISLSRQ
jgi:hypothetical protein